jgi:tetratricopeptide (TPR) repeat protein
MRLTTEQKWLVNSLAPLVGSTDGGAPSTAETSFSAWQRFLEGVAAQRPLIAVFEDLHWADDQLLAFVEHLVEFSSGVPLLVLCTARPELYERAAGWGGGKRNSNTISLSPLGPDDTARLLAALLQRAVLPAETQSRLIEHAGGNPLYAEEFVRMLGDTGLLTAEGSLRDGDIRVPDNVQALIAARLDTLPADRKALVHDAAVIGKVFWSGSVAAMSGVDEQVVRAGLHELVRKELVRAIRESSVKDQTEYAFWHALVRDVAYAQIPRGARAQKHVAAAEWVERMAGERVTDHAELLAYHYERALELARAASADADVQPLVDAARRAFELAGDRIVSLDLHKSFTYYVRAADLYAPDDVNRGRLLLKALRGRGGSAATAEQLGNEAIAIFRSAGDEVNEGAALDLLASVLWIRGATARSHELELEALAILERHPPGDELLTAYTRRAGSIAIGGRPEEALELIDKALRLSERLDSRTVEGRLYQYRGIARVDLGDLGGIDDVRKGLELALDAGDLATAGIGYSNLASNLYPLSATDALAVWEEGVEFTEKRGILGNRFWQLAESTWALFDLGRWDEVVSRATEVVEWAESGGLSYGAAIAANQHALVLLQRGELEAAAELLEKFVPVAREIGDAQVLVPALAASAQLAVARGDVAAAVGFAREVETRTRTGASMYRPLHLPGLVAIALAGGADDVASAFLETEYGPAARVAHSFVAARAVAAEAAGTFEDALRLYEDAAAGWNDYGFVLGRAEALHGAGRCLVALGRPQQAVTPLREAHAAFARLDARPGTERVDDTLAAAASRTA